MNNNGLISIIVPVYNAEKYLKQCVDSILEQTYQEYELILVDDGSTDNSWEIISEYMKESEKIKGIRKENGGPNSARKKGLEIANGQFVMFVDADDYVDRKICYKLLNTMITQQADIVLSKAIKVLNGKKLDAVGMWKAGKYTGKHIAENIIDQNIFYINYIPMGLWGNLYKSDIIKNIFQQIDLKIDFSEDYACFLLAVLDSEYVYFLDEILYYYRQNEFSFTHEHSKSNYDSQKRLHRFLTEQLKKRTVSSVIYRQLEWIIIRDLLLGGYETFKEKNYLYPFLNVEKGANIIIYGAGVLGGELFAFVNQYHICNIVLWVDQNWEEYRKNGFPVSAIEDIHKMDYDYLVIAIMKTNIAEKIRKELEKQGIKKDKIKLIDQKLISYNELPENFWE